MRNRFVCLTVMFSQVFIGFSNNAYAAGVDAGQLLNEQQRLQLQKQPGLPQAEPDEPSEKIDPAAAGQKVRLTAVRFQNAQQLVSDAQLQQWVAAYIGKDLNFDQLKQLADRVSWELRNMGYLLAKAYLPKQDITGGVLQVNIIQGHIDNQAGISIKAEHLRIDQQLLHDRLRQNVRPGQALAKADLERALLTINDLPGLAAHASLGAGQSSGSSKITVTAKEGPLLGGSVWGDNFGNHYTGEWRGNAVLDINDPFKIGDQLRLSFTGSEGIQLGSARYSIPLMANGLSFESHFSQLQYQIGREFVSAQLAGEATSIGSSLNYPLIRSRAFSLWANAGYDHRALRDNANQTQLSDRQINEAALSINTSLVDGWLDGAVSYARLGLVAGKLDRSDNPVDLRTDTRYANSQGGFGKFVYSLSRLQKLNNQLTFLANFNGQQASGNLDSSEKYILGGPSGVRAYAVGEASGDHGWVLNTELRWDLPLALPIGKLQLLGFIDTGRITLHDHTWSGAISSQTGKNTYQLSGGGISLSLYQTNRYQLTGTWAAPIAGNPGRNRLGNGVDGQAADHRFWLQAVLWF